MGVATETQQGTREIHPLVTRLRAEGLLYVISVGALVIAAALLMLYAYSAIRWQSRPFVGVLTNESLRVQDIQPLSDQEWALKAQGVRHGDEIIGMNGVEWPDQERAERFSEILNEADFGERIAVVVQAAEEYGTIACQGRDAATCEFRIRPQQLPAVDFIVHFGVGFVVGGVLLLLGGLLLWRRSDLRAARLLAVGCAMLGVVSAGSFDLFTTFSFIPLWMLAGYVVAGVLISVGMSFPFDLAMVRRVPTLRYAPLFAAFIATFFTYQLYQSGWMGVALYLPLLAIVLSALALGGLMVWRRQYSSSPIIREQATFVAGGALVAFSPLFIWLAYIPLSGGNILNLWTPVSQITVILFALSAGYAVSQYRLLETDRIIPEFLVYGSLTALLLGGYSLISIGLGWVTSDAISADNPLLIAVTMGGIVLLFNPVYRYLRETIDKAMFRTRRGYQQRLESFTRSLADAVNLSSIYNAIQAELNETVSPSHVFMFAYDERSKGYTALPLPNKARPETDIVFDAEGGVARYLRDEQSVLYLEQGQPLPMTAARDRSLLAVLGAPLLMRLQGRNRLQGILAVGPRRNGDAYSYEDLRYIESLIDQATFAIERAQFVDDLEHRVRIQDVLSQVSRALNYAIDFDTLLELIFAQTTRIIDADQFHIVLYDRTTQDLRYSFYTDGDERLYAVERLRWKLGKDVISQVITKQIPMRLDDFVAEQKRRDPDYQPVGTPIHAWMGVPLISETMGKQSGAMGLMAVGSSDAGVRFSDEQVQLFQDIGNIASSAIDKTQLFHKTELRAAQLKALNDISNQLASELEDVDRLLQTITENAVSILGSEAGSLLLVDDHSGDLVFRVVTGGGGHNLLGTRITRGQPSLVADAVNRATPIIVNDPAKDERWHGEVTEEGDTGQVHFASRAILTVPLVSQGVALGALQVINKQDGSGFTDEDSSLATTFAGQAAVAIQNARLFETQDKQLLARVQELESLAEIDHSLNQTLILDQLVKIIMDWALRQTGTRYGAMFLVDSESDQMELLTSYGYPESSIISTAAIGESFPIDTGILGRVIRSRTPSLMTNLQDDPNYLESLPNCKAQVSVPLVQGATVIGALLLEADADGVLDLFDMTFLQRLAERASSAVSNAILYSQLQEQQQARTDFVRNMAHELNNPITSMKGYTSFLIRGLVGPLNEKQAEFLQVVNSNVEHLELLVSDIRDMEIIDAQGRLPLQMNTVDFGVILHEALQTVQQAFEQKNQEVVLNVEPELPEIWAEATRIKQILLNFLTNANKYTEENGQVEVYAKPEDNIWDDKGVRRVLHISVKDNGLGISQEDLQKLFVEKYFRSTNPKALDQKGTGLGLILTRRLIEQHGGKIWVESVLGEGTTFHFTLPLTSELLSEGS